MKVLEVTFWTLPLTCEKCDFEQPSIVFAIFSTLAASIFGLKYISLSGVVSKLLRGRTFHCFGNDFDPKMDPKSGLKFSKIDWDFQWKNDAK